MSHVHIVRDVEIPVGPFPSSPSMLQGNVSVKVCEIIFGPKQSNLYGKNTAVVCGSDCAIAIMSRMCPNMT
jgi:hypothetical protein